MNPSESSSLLGGIKLIVDLWPLLALLASLVFGAAMLFLRSRFISRASCKEIRQRIAEQQAEVAEQQEAEAGRLQSVEHTLKNLPTSADMAALELTIERLTGRVRELEAVVAGQRDLMRRVEMQLDRVDTYLRGLK